MNFLSAYVDYAKRVTDAPPIFHFWLAVALLASALGNNCWTWAWGRRVCPNLWIVLVADSGTLRKTTSLRIGEAVLAEALPDAAWPSEWSTEALSATMQERPSGTLFISEYRRFHKSLEREYAGGSKELLTDCYDNPPLLKRRTMKAGTVEIHLPAPSIIAATNGTWFEASLQADDIGGGFLSRMIIVPGHEKGDWRGLGATRSDADGILRTTLADHLKSVRAKMAGEVDIQQIEQPFNKWLRSYEDKWTARCTPELSGTVARSGATALKLATIFQASADPSLTISQDSFERAKKMVEFSTERIAGLLAEGLGLDREGRQRKRVLTAIKRAHPEALAHSDVLRNLNVSARHLEQHIATLVQSNEVAITNIDPTASGGRPGKAYRWLNGANPS